MHFLVGHNLPGCLPDTTEAPTELDSFQNAVLALLGDLQSNFVADDSDEADNLIFELEELLPVFKENGTIDQAAWDSNPFADPFRAMVAGRADQVAFIVDGEVYWIFQA